MLQVKPFCIIQRTNCRRSISLDEAWKQKGKTLHAWSFLNAFVEPGIAKGER